MVLLSVEQLEKAKNDGLYIPHLEKDSCGVGFVASIRGIATHQVLCDGRKMLQRLAHRGACACDNDSGDGAGVMTAIPDALYRKDLKNSEEGIELPPVGEYATGLLFLRSDSYEQAIEAFADLAKGCDLAVIAWRKLRTNPGKSVLKHVFVTAPYAATDKELFKRNVYILRKQAVTQLAKQKIECYVVSLSSSTIIYKGQFTPTQLYQYYSDLTNPEYVSHMAMVHSRFSTNTFRHGPELNHIELPVFLLRMVAHNGEINTLRGNINFMHAREGFMKNHAYGNNLQKLYPVVERDMSDSGCFDNVLEFLVHAGNRSLPEAAMTMVPEAWENDEEMAPERRSFYRWAAMLMEPWDGPALMTFSDGRYVGAILDRNGLRPARFYITKDDHIFLASEVGIADLAEENIVRKRRRLNNNNDNSGDNNSDNGTTTTNNNNNHNNNNDNNNNNNKQ
ncbi:Glutamate synthase (Large subunit) [Dirofilaria immitis]|nr:Glutamate synthase (Large subunit) [Dirofilaria immitis]